MFDTYIYNLVNTVATIRQSTLKVLGAFKDDGVRYLELRTTPRAIPDHGVSKELYIMTVLDSISDFCKQDGDELSVYLILSVDRKQSPAEAMETVDLAVNLRARGYDRIVGIDLCGNPARGSANIPNFRTAFTRAKDAGLKITLHFAETLASGTIEELETLLSFKPDRLGHVIHIPDEIKAEISKRKPGLELCLSCNVLAQLTTGGFDAHHFGDWRGKGCPITLGVSTRC